MFMLAFNLKIWEWLNRSARHAVKAVALVVLIGKLAHNTIMFLVKFGVFVMVDKDMLSKTPKQFISNSVSYHKHYERKLAQFMPGPGNLL